MRDEDLLREAIRRGHIQGDQVPQILKVQKEIGEKGFAIDLPKILVMKGLLSQGQVDSILNGDRPKTYQQFGPYEILGKLGEGAMGVVYKAVRPEQPNRPVALKIMNASTLSDQESQERFKREAQALVQMRHPNIVQGYDCGEINGRLYVAMELLEGKMLCDAIRERGFIPEQEAIQIGLDIGQALSYMHAQHFVHRDVKPDNILITPEGSCKLTDLGLAKASGPEAAALTAPGKTLGTPAYMSPEHLQCERDLDIRTDIYSLGASLFHAVTGSMPYEAPNPFEIIGLVLQQPVPNARERRKDVSENLAKLLQMMMAKDRLDRHETPAQVIADLQRVQQGRPPERKAAASPDAPRKAPTTKRVVIQGELRASAKSSSTSWLVVVGILLGLGVLGGAAYYFFK
jgi:serine/threonine-protein kinase